MGVGESLLKEAIKEMLDCIPRRKRLGYRKGF
jgi:hypothetical protein